MTGQDQLSVTFGALADPTRRKILERLLAGAATVSELAEPLPISQPAVSKHLKVLERAGLISRSRTAQWRSSALEPQALLAASMWMEPYRVLWEQRLDNLEAHLRRVQDNDERTADA